MNLSKTIGPGEQGVIPFQSVSGLPAFEETEVQRCYPCPLCSLHVGSPRPRVLSSSPLRILTKPTPTPSQASLSQAPSRPAPRSCHRVTQTCFAHSHSFRLPRPAPGLAPLLPLAQAPVIGKQPGIILLSHPTLLISLSS